jgi:octaprenyl-diphosphate synthase
MDQEYTQRIKKIEAELEKWFPENTEASRKLFPAEGKKISPESLQTLFEPGKDILSRGGKRWRPLLMTLICESFGGGDASLPLAPLVEFCHNASLIHDDIEDDSSQRRGKPAIHKIYGIDTAINSGSFLYFLALSCVEIFVQKNDIQECKNHIYKLWADCMRGLHLGQAMDISWHRTISFFPDTSEYYTMCGLKTGSLARLAAELGAFTANVSQETECQLGEAAEKLGIGFQILDDVKNLTTGIPGKMRGDDIVEGKKSLPVLLFLHKYPEKRGRIFSCFFEAKTNGYSAPEIEEMIQMLTASGVLTEAEEKGRTLIEEARGIFNSPRDGIPFVEKSRTLLDGFINLII